MPKRGLILCCIIFLLFVNLTAQTGSIQPDTKIELPDSEDELHRLLDETERKIKDLDPKTNEWETIIVSLQAAKDGVTTAKLPDPSVVDGIKTFLATKKFAEAAKKIAPAKFLLSSMVRQASPNIFSREGLKPDTLLFNGKWQNKIESIQGQFIDEGTINDFILLDEQKPSADDFTNDKLQSLKSSLTKAKDLQKALGAGLDDLMTEAKRNKDSINNELNAMYDKQSAIAAKLGKAKQSINELAIRLGLPMFCGTVLLMLCIPILLQMYKRSGASEGSTAIEQLKAIFGSGILVEIITVLLLTMTILILGLADKIKSEVLGTLLGGISGYVLNRFRKPQDKQEEQQVDATRPVPAPAPTNQAPAMAD